MLDLDTDTTRIYEYIRDYLRERRISPTLREIAKECYISRSTVVVKLATLEAKDWIVRDINVPRSIRLGEHAPDYIPDPEDAG